MNDQKFKEKIRETFENEVPDVLSKIKASPEFRVPEKKEGFSLKSIFNRKFTLSFMSAFVVILVAVVMLNRNDSVVATTITLDVNPSIEITLNDDDYVIGVTALNDDGDEVIQKDIKYRGLKVDKAMEIIMNRLNELGYIVTASDENNIVLIDVSSPNGVIQRRVSATVQAKLQSELEKYSQSGWVLNSQDIDLTTEQKRLITQSQFANRYTNAKLVLIYRINTLDDTYLIEDLVELTVRELYDIYIQIEDQGNLPNYNQMPPSRRQNNHNPYNDSNQIIVS